MVSPRRGVRLVPCAYEGGNGVMGWMVPRGRAATRRRACLAAAASAILVGRMRSSAWLVLLAACAAPRPVTSSAPPAAPAVEVEMPRPARARLEAAVAQNAACASCHREVAEEWRA